MLPALCPPLQIVDEKMLVYINDLLASGEIPDLFAQVRMPACSIHMGAAHAARWCCGGVRFTCLRCLGTWATLTTACADTINYMHVFPGGP